MDGWWDPDPMAMAPPGEPGCPAEFPNRLFLFLMISPTIFIFGYFGQRNTSDRSILRPPFYTFKGLLKGENGALEVPKQLPGGSPREE